MLYAAVLVAALAAAWTLQTVGVSPAIAGGATVAAGALAVWWLERARPLRADWRPTLAATRTDLAHIAVTIAFVSPAVTATSIAAAAWLGGELAAAWGIEMWPHRWPAALQIAIAVVAADLGAYAGHRFMHRSPLGWRIHAVHHSATALNWLAAGRAHPLNAALTLSLEGAILVMLGCPTPVFALASVFKAVNGMLQHANADLRPGALSHVVATNEIHRRHHSLLHAESNVNFGNATVVWDRAFGTLVPSRTVPTRVGIEGYTVPETYRDHLATPFALPRWRR